MSKQDRQGARTATDLERRYNFGKKFSEILGVANDASESAQEASRAIKELDQETIFNLLTNNGEVQGIYRDEEGNVYINASFIVTGILKSIGGNTYYDLDRGEFVTINTNTGAKTTLSSTGLYQELIGGLLVLDNGIGMTNNGTTVFDLRLEGDGIVLGLLPTVDEWQTEHPIQWKTIAGIPMITDPSAEFSFSALGVQATIDELNYLSGVKSSIQDQIDELSRRITELGG